MTLLVKKLMLKHGKDKKKVKDQSVESKKPKKE